MNNLLNLSASIRKEDHDDKKNSAQRASSPNACNNDVKPTPSPRLLSPKLARHHTITSGNRSPLRRMQSKNMDEQSHSSRLTLRSGRSLRFQMQMRQKQLSRHRNSKARSRRQKGVKKQQQQIETVQSDSDEDKLRYVNKDNWREALKPIDMNDDEYGQEDDSYDQETGRIIKKNQFEYPDQRMRRFDPIPSDDMLHWIYFYFFPYNRTFNTARCMTFDGDERADQIAYMNQQYNLKHYTLADKKMIQSYIKDMENDLVNFHNFNLPHQCTWYELFANFIITKDLHRRERIMKLFDRIADLEEGTFRMPKNMHQRRHFKKYLERKLRKEAAERKARQEKENSESRSCSCESAFSAAHSCRHGPNSDPGDKSPVHDLLSADSKLRTRRKMRRANTNDKLGGLLGKLTIEKSRKFSVLTRQPVDTENSRKITSADEKEEPELRKNTSLSPVKEMESSPSPSPKKAGVTPDGKINSNTFAEGVKLLMNESQQQQESKVKEASPNKGSDGTPTPLLPRAKNLLHTATTGQSNPRGRLSVVLVDSTTPTRLKVKPEFKKTVSSGNIMSNLRSKLLGSVNDLNAQVKQKMDQLNQLSGAGGQRTKIIRKANHRESITAAPSLDMCKFHSTRVMSTTLEPAAEEKDAVTAEKDAYMAEEHEKAKTKDSILANWFRKNLRAKLETEAKQEAARREAEEAKRLQNSPGSPNYRKLLRQSSLKAGKISKEEAEVYTINVEARTKERELQETKKKFDFLGAKKRRKIEMKRALSTQITFEQTQLMNRQSSSGGVNSFKDLIRQKNMKDKQTRQGPYEQQEEPNSGASFMKMAAQNFKSSANQTPDVINDTANEKQNTESKAAEQKQDPLASSFIKLMRMKKGDSSAQNGESEMASRGGDTTGDKMITSSEKEKESIMQSFQRLQQKDKIPSIDRIQFENSPKSDKEKNSVSSATDSGSENILNIKKPQAVSSVHSELEKQASAKLLTQSTPMDQTDQKESLTTSRSDSANGQKDKNKSGKVLRKKSSTRMFTHQVKFQKDSQGDEKQEESKPLKQRLPTIMIEGCNSDSDCTPVKDTETKVATIAEVDERQESTPVSPDNFGAESPQGNNRNEVKPDLPDIAEVDEDEDEVQSSELHSEKKTARLDSLKKLQRSSIETGSEEKLSSLKSSSEEKKIESDDKKDTSKSKEDGVQVLAKIDIRIERDDDVSLASSFESGSSFIEIRKKKNTFSNSSQLTFGGLVRRQQKGHDASNAAGGPSPALAALQADLKTPKESQSAKTSTKNDGTRAVAVNFQQAAKGLRIKPVRQMSNIEGSSSQEPYSGFFAGGDAANNKQSEEKLSDDDSVKQNTDQTYSIKEPEMAQARAALRVVNRSSDGSQKLSVSNCTSQTSVNTDQRRERAEALYRTAEKPVEVIQPREPAPTVKLPMGNWMSQNQSSELNQFQLSFKNKQVAQATKPIENQPSDNAQSDDTTPLETESSKESATAQVKQDGTPLLKTDSKASESGQSEKGKHQFQTMDMESREACHNAIVNLFKAKSGLSPGVDERSTAQQAVLGSPQIDSLTSQIKSMTTSEEAVSRNMSTLSQKQRSSSRIVNSLNVSRSISKKEQKHAKLIKKKSSRNHKNLGDPVKKLNLGNCRKSSSKVDAEFERLISQYSKESTPSPQKESSKSQQQDGENPIEITDEQHQTIRTSKVSQSLSSVSSDESSEHSSSTSSMKTESDISSDSQEQSNTKTSALIHHPSQAQTKSLSSRSLVDQVIKEEEEDIATEEKRLESKTATSKSQLTSITVDSSDKHASTPLESSRQNEQQVMTPVETNVAGLKLNNYDQLDNDTSDSDSFEEDMIWQNPDSWDIEQLISLYANIPKDALHQKKPKLDYRCSRGHCLHNPTVIHRSKIVLEALNEEDYAKAGVLQRDNSWQARLSDLSEDRQQFLQRMAEKIRADIIQRCKAKGSNKFRMMKRSQAIMRAMLEADRKYYAQQFGNGEENSGKKTERSISQPKQRASSAKGRKHNERLTLNKKNGDSADKMSAGPKVVAFRTEVSVLEQRAGDKVDLISNEKDVGVKENRANLDAGKRKDLFANSKNSRPSRGIMREAYPTVVAGRVHRQIPGFDAAKQKSARATIQVKKELLNTRTLKTMQEAELEEKGMKNISLIEQIRQQRQIKVTKKAPVATTQRSHVNITEKDQDKPSDLNGSDKMSSLNLQTIGDDKISTIISARSESIAGNMSGAKRLVQRNRNADLGCSMPEYQWSTRQSLPAGALRKQSAFNTMEVHQYASANNVTSCLETRNSELQPPTRSVCNKKERPIYRYDAAHNLKQYQEKTIMTKLQQSSEAEIRREIIECNNTKQLQKMIDKQRQKKISQTITSATSQATCTALDKENLKRMSNRLLSPDYLNRSNDWMSKTCQLQTAREKRMVTLSMSSTNAIEMAQNGGSARKSNATGNHHSRNSFGSPRLLNNTSKVNKGEMQAVVRQRLKRCGPDGAQTDQQLFLRTTYSQFAAAVATKTTNSAQRSSQQPISTESELLAAATSSQGSGWVANDTNANMSASFIIDDTKQWPLTDVRLDDNRANGSDSLRKPLLLGHRRNQVLLSPKFN